MLVFYLTLINNHFYDNLKNNNNFAKRNYV